MLETPLGDFRLSPAYDLLNSRLHIEDRDFALEDGLIPQELTQGKVKNHFLILGEQAEIPLKLLEKVFKELTSKQNEVKTFIEASFLDEKTKRNYLQCYQTRVNKLERI